MFFVLCQSRAVSAKYHVHDLEVMRSSLKNNRNTGITGFLYRNATHYFQCIEGARAEVDRLMLRLGRDHRHFDVRILMTGESRRRKFTEWSMGYSREDDAHSNCEITEYLTPDEILAALIRESNWQMQVLYNKERHLLRVS